MNFYLFFYFLAGVIQDFFFTLNLRLTAKEKALPAATFAFLETIITMIVLYQILTKLDKEGSIVAIIFYALGIGLGSFIAIKFKKDL